MTESRVVITADAARGVAEFHRFRAQAVGALESVSAAGGVIGKVLGGIGASISIAAFTGWIKGAVDATDAASDLSQKTGIAIEDLAGMELAFQKGGMEAGVLEGTMSKLSKQIVEGSEAFERLGIQTKNANGDFKNNKDMLYELADQFANMEDGVRKTALAQEIFGKSGAAMIPMLNEGSKGLREMDEMAHKLGLSLSQDAVEQAGNFNDTLDLLVLGGQGVARGIAAELLPTLSNLTGQFLTTMTSGDKLKNTAAFLAAGLKILYTVGIGIVEVFSTVGKTIGAAGAQIVALLQGNFSMAAEIGRQWRDDIGGSWKATLASIEAAWASTSDGTVDSMVKFTRNSTVVGMSAAELAEQSKKTAKALDEEAKALAELSGLSGTFAKDWDQLTALYNRKKISVEQLTKAQAELLAKQPGIKAAAEAELAERKALADAAEQYGNAYDKAAAAKAKAVTDLDAQREENRLIGLSAIELAELNAVRLESQARRADENAEIAEGLDLTGQLAQQYRDEAEALRSLAGEQRDGVRKKIAADEAKSAEEDWKRASQDIEKSLTDSLLRGFESGQSIGKNLINNLKNMFNTLVLRPVISAVVNPVAGAVSGMLGLPSAAAAAGTGGAAASGGGSMAGSLLGAAGSLFGAGGLAGSLMAGAGWLTGATTLTGSLTAATSLMATGTMGGIASGLGMVAGALGPIAIGIGAAVALWKKLDTGGTYHTGGASSASAAGVSTIRAESLNFERTRTDAEVEKMTAQLASGVVGILDSTAAAFGKTAGYTAATAFADDTSKDGAWGGLRIMLGESKVLDWQDTRTSRWAPKEFANGEAGRTQYLAEISKSVRVALDGIGLPGWAKGMLDAVGEGASLEELAKVADSINSTQAALKAMGEQLVGFSSLSDAAVSALIKAAGGIQGLASSAAAYYDNFYTQAEKESVIRKDMTDALHAAGLAVPATREAYRALAEQQLAMGEAGAAGAATLFKWAQVFAQLNPVVEQLTPALEELSPALGEVSNGVSTAVEQLAEAKKGLQQQIDGILLERMTPEQRRNYDIRDLDDEGVKLYDRLQFLKKEDDAMAERKGLEERLLELQIASGQASGKQAVALFAVNQKILDQVLALEAQEAALMASKQNAATLMGNVDAAYGVLQRAIGRQKAAVQSQITVQTDIVNRHKELSGILHGALDAAKAAGSELGTRRSAQADIRAALTMARAGVLPDAERIKKAVSVLGQDSADLYATQVDYLRDFYTTQNDLAELASLTDDALSVEEQQLKALQAEVDRLDQILERARQEIDVLKGIDDSVFSVEQAVQALAGAILLAQANPIISANSSIAKAYQGSLGRAPDAAGLAFWQAQAEKGVPTSAIVDAIANSAEARLQRLYQETLGRPADADGLAFYLKQVGKGVSYEAIKAAMAGSDEAIVKAKGIPAFVNGGAHGGGIRLVGEQGPELEVTGPSRIHSTRDLMASLRSPSDNNSVLVAAVERLTAENAQMRRDLNDALYAIAKNTMEAKDTLDKWETIGQPTTRPA